MPDEGSLLRMNKKWGLVKGTKKLRFSAVARKRLRMGQELDMGLLKAVLKQDKDGVNKALDDGAHIDFQGSSGLTPLMWACQNDLADMVDLLLDRGARTDLKDVSGRTALDFALGGKNAEIVGMLKARGAKSGAELD